MESKNRTHRAFADPVVQVELATNASRNDSSRHDSPGDSPDRAEAERRLQLVVEKYKARAPRLSQWLEANVGEGLTVFAFPRSHWRRLRTSNLVERLSQEIKRRLPACTICSRNGV